MASPRPAPCFARDALACIRYGYFQFGPGAQGAQADLSIGRSEFQCVIHQICKNLCEPVTITRLNTSTHIMSSRDSCKRIRTIDKLLWGGDDLGLHSP